MSKRRRTSHIVNYYSRYVDHKIYIADEDDPMYNDMEVVSMTPTLTSAIEELRGKATALADEIVNDPRIVEIQKLLAALNPLEDLCGQTRTTLGGMLNFGADPLGESTAVQPDEFYGLDPLVAAKKFLKKPRKAVQFKDIVAAIRAGGGDPGNEEKLKVSLARSTWDIVKIGDDRFGLLEFYPHVKRGGKKSKVGNGDAVALRDKVKMEMTDLEGSTVLTRNSESEDSTQDDALENEASKA
jgi:hypothetical protein